MYRLCQSARRLTRMVKPQGLEPQQQHHPRWPSLELSVVARWWWIPCPLSPRPWTVGQWWALRSPRRTCFPTSQLDSGRAQWLWQWQGVPTVLETTGDKRALRMPLARRTRPPSLEAEQADWTPAHCFQSFSLPMPPLQVDATIPNFMAMEPRTFRRSGVALCRGTQLARLHAPPVPPPAPPPPPRTARQTDIKAQIGPLGSHSMSFARTTSEYSYRYLFRYVL